MRRNSDAAARVRRCLLLAVVALAACAELPSDYLSLSPQATADRELQGRRFDGIVENELLSAAVGVLQDLGFAIDTAGSALGFVQGTKEREAKASDQTLIVLIVAALAASRGGNVPVQNMREDQTISVLLSVRPAPEGDARSHVVLVTFHSHVRQPLWRTAGSLRDPVLYQSFFELLSKAIFLEAHKL